MLSKDTKELIDFYKPIVLNIVTNNRKYFQFNEQLHISFYYEENAAIIATCDRKTNIIKLNLTSLKKSYELQDLKTIEYYLLHEIRHVFQHLIVKDYNSGNEIPISIDIVKKWIYEFDNYIKAVDENGNENEEYFKQDSEMDAYAFSLAVMKHKYDDVSTLYIPSCYGEEFYSIIDEWIEYFNNEIEVSKEEDINVQKNN